MESLIASSKRLIYKFKCAFLGLQAGICYDKSILIQVILAFMTLIFFMFMHLTVTEWLFVVSAIFVVLISEFINSAIEDICDLLIREHDIQVKEIKDISAAAVLLAAIYALVVAGVILFTKFLG